MGIKKHWFFIALVTMLLGIVIVVTADIYYTMGIPQSSYRQKSETAISIQCGGVIIALLGAISFLFGKLIKIFGNTTISKPDSISLKIKYSLHLTLCLLAVIIIIWCSGFLVSYTVFHTSDHAKAIFNGVGRQVDFDVDNLSGQRPIRGTIKHIGYQFEGGKPWVVYMDIGVDYNNENSSGGIKTILSPFELNKVKFVDKLD